MQVEYSPVGELWQMLSAAPEARWMLLGVAVVPIVVTGALRLWLGRVSVLYRGSLSASILVAGGWAVSLLRTGPPVGLSRVGLWYFAFLLGYVPSWLVAALALSGGLWLHRRVRSRGRPEMSPADTDRQGLASDSLQAQSRALEAREK